MYRLSNSLYYIPVYIAKKATDCLYRPKIINQTDPHKQRILTFQTAICTWL